MSVMKAAPDIAGVCMCSGAAILHQKDRKYQTPLDVANARGLRTVVAVLTQSTTGTDADARQT